jgi:hypothetical protein
MPPPLFIFLRFTWLEAEFGAIFPGHGKDGDQTLAIVQKSSSRSKQDILPAAGNGMMWLSISANRSI